MNIHPALIPDFCGKCHVGIMKNSSMSEEIVLTLIGLGVFSLGRALERKVV